MSRRCKTVFLFLVAGNSAGIGIVMSANEKFLAGSVMLVIAFLSAWQALYLLTRRSAL